MPNAKKLPSGSWRVRVEDGSGPDGKRRWKSFTAATKKAAELAAAEYAVKRKAAQDPGNLTAREAVERYIDSRENLLSPSTVLGYRRQAKVMFPALMPVRLRALTPGMIQAAVNSEAKSVSPKTIRNRYALLCSALKAYSDIAPAAYLPPKAKTEITIPTDAQVRALLDVAHGTAMELPIMLAAYLGLRRSEISALKWDDYDPAAGTLHIHAAIVNGDGETWVEKAPKSYAGTRTLALPDVVRAALEAAPHTGESIVGLLPSQISKRWDRIAAQIGGLRFHALRHYNASVMLSLGVPDKYAMERLGQATPGVLRDVYQHTVEQRKKEISDALNAYFGPKKEDP